MSYRFNLGDPVTFTDTVVKDRDRERVTWTSAGLPVDATGPTQVKVTTGIVVGVRHLHDYRLEQFRESDGLFGTPSRWTEARTVPDTTRLAWIVAFGLRRRHVLVLDEHTSPRDGATPTAPTLRKAQR